MKLLVAATLFTAAVAQAQPADAPPDGAPPVDPGPATPAPATPAAPPPAAEPQPIEVTTVGVDPKRIDALVDARLAARPKAAGWADGFFIQSQSGDSRIKIGGYTQFDGRFFVADSADPHVDQFAFRSIRPEMIGTLFDHYDFRFLPDFAGGKLVVQEAYVDVRYGDAFKLRFGKSKVPFGLERLQLEVATTFVERGLPTQLVPNRDLGVQAFGTFGRGMLEYQLGVYNGVADGQSGDGDVSDDKELAARVFVRPFATNPSHGDLGIGVAATYGDKLGTLASPDVLGYKTEGQTTFFAYKAGLTSLADTVIADGLHWRATAQGYYYYGPFGVLAEYVQSRQHVAFNGSHDLAVADAWQVLAQWVLTGDKATFKSVTPRHPFDPSKGQWGAFDLAGRFDELRQVDGVVFDAGFADPTKSARRAYSATGGADWFPNKALRFVLDVNRTWYVLGAKMGDKPAETSIIGRAQTVF